MAIVERDQNVIIGDTVMLRLSVLNSNNYQNVDSIQQIDIYVLDPTDKTCIDPCGKRLVQTIAPDQISNDSVGNYSIALATSTPTYTIGNYEDVWTLTFTSGGQPTTKTNRFKLLSDLWYVSTTPVIYDFDFKFQPNRIRQGSITWLHIRIDPNVPTATDLIQYYNNIAISATLKIYIEQVCGPCTDPEKDLRMIVDGALVTVRDKVFGHYKLDTTDMDCGIYNVWFSLAYADSLTISNRNQLQIL